MVVSRIVHPARGRFAMLRTKALLERETLDEGDILEVTGPARAAGEQEGPGRGTFGPVRKGVKISRREHR
jgi:hypothetical protein